ncbi:HsdM family class I SAM-dependent methyltransferase [Pseudomonas viridiflava]|uniref:HsdM family class I SAM-dependent methyltransferase n=1 Tax=Pseudomonas viridiflava TaxID=33069 RepID=UPI000F09850C|nr:class I SAM-dependent DNA methyltransferase [Pseudomonas viridiflava]
MADHNRDATIRMAIAKIFDVFRGGSPCEESKHFVLPMLVLKYLSDVSDSDCSVRLSYRVPRQAHFEELKRARFGSHNGERINNALRLIEQANDELYGMFASVDFCSAKLGTTERADILLSRLLEAFDVPVLNFTMEHREAPGAAAEVCDALWTFVDEASGKRDGEAVTPPDVSRLLARLVCPAAGESVYDSCLGVGGSLIECGKQARLSNLEQGASLYGQEVNADALAFSRMNMVLHDEDSYRLEWGDSLRNPKLLSPFGDLMTFDIAVSQPPFSMREWGHEDAFHDSFGRYQRGIPPRGSADFAFISHMLKSLKPNGRMAVVVSLGVLFRSGAEGQIRMHLVRDKLIDAVIALPPKLFTHTGIPTAILLLRKDRKADDVLFIDASRTFEPGKIRNRLSERDLSFIDAAYQARSDVPQLARVVSQAEIAQHDYNLSVARYVEHIEMEEPVDVVVLRAERLQLECELASLEEKLEGLLARIGYDYRGVPNP